MAVLPILQLHFISIHAAQEGCDRGQPISSSSFIISIHAAQEGCDLAGCIAKTLKGISIHAAQEGCDSNSPVEVKDVILFQSTQPKRAATNVLPSSVTISKDFNPRSPRGLRQMGNVLFVVSPIFQSTQPKRAATYHSLPPVHNALISIHAAQEGCDAKMIKLLKKFTDFNPRSPRGLRQKIV